MPKGIRQMHQLATRTEKPKLIDLMQNKMRVLQLAYALSKLKFRVLEIEAWSAREEVAGSKRDFRPTGLAPVDDGFEN